MSCSSGSNNRTRPQKHQNRTTFKNNLHDTSKKTKLLNNLEVKGVCERCKEIIGWKIKYKKYKPLTAPKKCVNCDERNIKYAYHVLCINCAKKKNCCTKCCKPVEVIENNECLSNAANECNFQSILKGLPERKKRTLLRQIKKQQDEGHEVTNAAVEKLMSEMCSIKDDKSDESSEDDAISDSESHCK